MEGMRLLRSIRLANILSYGPESETIELQPLNVLIGPNGSGKSNLIEAISLLKAAPTDLGVVIREGGGIAEWVWKGNVENAPAQSQLVCILSYPGRPKPLYHCLEIAPAQYEFTIAAELIAEDSDSSDESSRNAFYRNSSKGPELNALVKVEEQPGQGTERRRQRIPVVGIDPAQSILSQRKDPDQYPEITYLAKVFSEIYLFRNPIFGHRSPLRDPQSADLTSGFLREDGKNLGAVLSVLLSRPQTKRLLLDGLKRFNESFEDITTQIISGYVEIRLHEHGLHDSIPAKRLSDGTLQYLCLLAILCHPTPPPLVCIEDPELGLHPSALPFLAEMMIDAAQRTQLIVTTHSEMLVHAFGHMPEAIVVCEKDVHGSHLRLLDPEQLKGWLEKYTLDELWSMGEIGGNP